MNFKFAWILFAVLLLGLGGLLVVSLLDDSPEAGEILLPRLATLKPEDIDTVEIVRAGGADQKLVLKRFGKERWDIVAPAKAKADPFVVNKILTDLLSLKPTTAPETLGSKASHGLNPAGLSVTVKSGAKTATLNVGDTSIGRSPITFITTDTRPDTPVAVLRSSIEGLFRPGTNEGKAADLARQVSDYRQKQFFKGDKDLLSESEYVLVAKAGKETKLIRNAISGDWSFASPAGYGVVDVAGDPQAPPASFTGVRPLITAITGLQAVASEDFIENPEPLEKYGLKPDDPNVIRVEVKTKDGSTETVYIGKKIDDKPETTKYFCKSATDTAVVKASLTQDRLNALAKTASDPTDLRDRSVIPELKQLTVDAIDITVGGSLTRLRKLPMGAESRWVLYGGPNDPQLAGLSVTELLSSLSKARLAKELLTAPNDAAFAEGARVAELKFWYESLEKPKDPVDPEKLPAEVKFKSETKPSVTLLFGKKEGDAVFVRRTTADGIVSDLKLPESVLPLASRDRLGYLDARLKPFPTNIVKKLSFTRGNELITVESDGKATADQWKFTSPQSLKDQIADAEKVMGLLNFLAMSSPTRVVAESPTDADLAKFGVGAAPRTKVTLTLDTEKDNERIFEFGTETEDKGAVHLRTNTKSVVSVVPKFVLDRITTDDLRDRRLFQLDKTKVKTIRLLGWKQALGKPTKYVLSRTSDSWVITSPVDSKMTLDPTKVELLLDNLAAPRAVDYVPESAVQQVDLGMNHETSPNTFIVILEIDEKTDYRLVFGNETDAGANVFARCDRKPDLFKYSLSTLRPFRERPESLMKQAPLTNVP